MQSHSETHSLEKGVLSWASRIKNSGTYIQHAAWALSPEVNNLNMGPQRLRVCSDVAQEIDKLFPLNRPREEDGENDEPGSFFYELWELVICVAASRADPKK